VTDHHRRRAAFMLALMVAGTAVMGLTVWATTPPEASAHTGGAPAPAPAKATRGAAAAAAAIPTTVAVAARAGAVPGCTPVPLAERAARTLIVGLPGVTDPADPLVKEVVDLGVGGVFINNDNVKSRAQVVNLIRGIRTRAGRAILIATDEEPGRVSVFRDIVGSSPSARRLAAQETLAGARQHAATVAGLLSSMGIDLDLAPVADLDDGPSSGIIGDRSFSDDPTVAANYAYAYAAGLADGGVLPVAKHFPGQGRSSEDVDVRAASVTITLDTLQSTDLRPFDSLIRAGIPAVMVNHLRYSSLDPSLPASLSPRAYQLLRGLGFRGAAITDSVGMGAVNRTWDVAEAAVKAVAAGADGVLNTGGRTAKDMRHGLVAAVQSGRLDESRMDEAASRIVALAGGDPTTVTCTRGQWLPEGDFSRAGGTAGSTPARPGVATQPTPDRTQPTPDRTQLAPVVAPREPSAQR
jgi:beta-N-acetylhexosaminidase